MFKERRMLATGLNQQNVLYHSIPLEHAVNVIRNNRIYGMNYHRMWEDGRVLWNRNHPDYSKHQWVKGINFSRSKHFTVNWHHLKPRLVLTFDWDKLKTRYKFIPYTWFELHPKGKGIFKAEAEEFLPMEYTEKSGDGSLKLEGKNAKNRIDDVLSYVVSAELIVPVVDLTGYPSKTVGRNAKEVEKLLKKYNIPHRISTETVAFLEK